MVLANVYVQVYGQLADFFAKLQEGQAPDHFTQRHLKDLGFTSANHRAFIPLLKALDFLTPEGVPTPRYHEYRSKAQGPRVIAEALRHAYGDVFFIKEHPTDADRDLIEGKFKSAHNVSDRVAKLMSNTFFSLLVLADMKRLGQKKPKKKGETEGADEPAREDTRAETGIKESPLTPPVQPAGTQLHYNIQIHLPATKDVEVFNAIFKSLKEHLLD